MINLVLRCVIIYLIVIACVRLMGKRQIGELQPSELVITILISDVASMPLQNTEMPLLNAIISLLVLVMLEVLISVLSIKFRSVRKLLQGNSIMIIDNGQLIEKNMKLIRYTIDDLTEALRLKDIFDLSQIQYAYIETNGSISINLKPQFSPVTKSDMNINVKESSIPFLVICDGKIIDNEFNRFGMTKEKLMKKLSEMGIKPQDILVMTIDSQGKTYLKMKENIK